MTELELRELSDRARSDGLQFFRVCEEILLIGRLGIFLVALLGSGASVFFLFKEQFLFAVIVAIATLFSPP
jgi:hypothetical protein